MGCILIVGADGVAGPREPLSARYPEAWQAYLAWLEREEQEPLPAFES